MDDAPARMMFEEARSACARIAQVAVELEALEEGEWDGRPTWTPRPGGSKAHHPDPTCSRAMALIDAMSNGEREYDELAVRIEDALRVVEAVRDGLGAVSAEVLDLCYLSDRDYTWREIAWEVERVTGSALSADACRMRRDRALDWIDARGWGALVEIVS